MVKGDPALIRVPDREAGTCYLGTRHRGSRGDAANKLRLVGATGASFSPSKIVARGATVCLRTERSWTSW
jgi:hypothetical protein